MHRCDVLIVGGGPAGSSLAWSLRDSGLAVTVLDRRTFPRDKVCAGWITPAVIDALQVDTEKYREGRVFQPISGFRVSLLGRPQMEAHYGGVPVSYGIRRCEFDHFLLQRTGAHLLLGTAFRSMAREGAGWLVNESIRARIVVGAGGHFCPVARAMGWSRSGSEQIVAAQEMEFEMTPRQERDCRIHPEVPELFFTPELDGYGWVFRKGNFLNIGLGQESREKLPAHVSAFREYLIAIGKVPPDIPEKPEGHAYLLYHHARRELLDDDVLLVGDSAGLAYPESGEGIRPAVETGLLAGRVIAAAEGDYRRDRLAPYQQQVTRRFGTRQPRRDLLGHVPMALKRRVAVPLFRSKWFVRNVLLDRWFLHSHLPPLFAS